MHSMPTEFEGGHLEAIALELERHKANEEDWDIVLIMCMLNGLIKTNKKFQVIPQGYEGRVRKLFAAAQHSGRRVIVVLGGDGGKWSIGGAPYFNKVRVTYIQMCNIEYDVVCVSGVHWFEAMVMADDWHGLTCDGSSEIYRTVMRNSVEFAYACLPPRPDQ